jgi:hypothetical protein
VNEHHVDVVDAEFFPETIEVCTNAGGIARVSLRKNGDFISRKLLERSGNIRMTAILIRRVEEAQAILVVAVEEEVC